MADLKMAASRAPWKLFVENSWKTLQTLRPSLVRCNRMCTLRTGKGTLDTTCSPSTSSNNLQSKPVNSWQQIMTSNILPSSLYQPSLLPSDFDHSIWKCRQPLPAPSHPLISLWSNTAGNVSSHHPSIQASGHHPSIQASSVVKKRRRHMNRHKYRKRRKAQRFLRRKLGR